MQRFINFGDFTFGHQSEENWQHDTFCKCEVFKKHERFPFEKIALMNTLPSRFGGEKLLSYYTYDYIFAIVVTGI